VDGVADDAGAAGPQAGMIYPWGHSKCVNDLKIVEDHYKNIARAVDNMAMNLLNVPNREALSPSAIKRCVDEVVRIRDENRMLESRVSAMAARIEHQEKTIRNLERSNNQLRRETMMRRKAAAKRDATLRERPPSAEEPDRE
jgi:hypothetical protein